MGKDMRYEGRKEGLKEEGRKGRKKKEATDRKVNR
jgi:hypothetical protein